MSGGSKQVCQGLGLDEEVSPHNKLDSSMELICTWSSLETILVPIQSFSNERERQQRPTNRNKEYRTNKYKFKSHDHLITCECRR